MIFMNMNDMPFFGNGGNSSNGGSMIVEQVQADWDETDETSPAFIMNKPENLGGSTVIFQQTNSELWYNSKRVGDEDCPLTKDNLKQIVLSGKGFIKSGESFSHIYAYFPSSGYIWVRYRMATNGTDIPAKTQFTS